MVKNEPSQNKIERYREHLKKPFWELHEAAFFFAGFTDFIMHHELTNQEIEIFKIKKIGLLPLPQDSYTIGLDKKGFNFSSTEFTLARQELLHAAKNDEIQTFPLNMRTFHEKEGLTHLIVPQEAISFALTHGILLPIELQIALDLYQLEPINHLTEPRKKQLQRHATIQALWYKHPNFSIAKICQVLDGLRKDEFGFFDAIFASSNRNKKAVSELRPEVVGTLPIITGLIHESEMIIRFDFQSLYIVVNALADWLWFEEKNITFKELISHPLIKYYSAKGGEAVCKIVQFSLKKHLEYMGLERMASEL